VSDPTCERLRELQVWQLAYCRDVVTPLPPEIKGVRPAKGKTMVGRAYTVDGPEIYINALESIGPGEVYVQAGCSLIDSVFSPGWTHAYLAPRGAVGCVVDGGVYKSFECHKAAVPLFSRFVSPSVAINRATSTTIGATIHIGGVRISAGDIIAGDEDGGVCSLSSPRTPPCGLRAGLRARRETRRGTPLPLRATSGGGEPGGGRPLLGYPSIASSHAHRGTCTMY
jgi:regulator of RNase E activity RraA